MLHPLRAVAVAAALAAGMVPAAVWAADDTPDLSQVALTTGDLPGGFRIVPEDELTSIGSLRELGEGLADSLEEAEFQIFQVASSEDGDELIEMVLIAPLDGIEQSSFAAFLADPDEVLDALPLDIGLDADVTEPVVIDTTGIGDASVAYTVDLEATTSSGTIPNAVGYEWSTATWQMVLGVRGSAIFVVQHQQLDEDPADIDFLDLVRLVDSRISEALGMAPPGVYRPGGTFSPGIANNIPTMADISTEPKVVLANLILAAVAVLVLTIAMRMLNTTLVAHEDALERMMRPARALGGWWRAADDSLARRGTRLVGVVRVAGVLLFYGVLFSFLEDGWRPWTLSGIFLLLSMTFAFGVVGTTDDMVELRSARRWGKVAQLAVKPAFVLLAIGSVVLTKLANLVPGLLIGTPEAFSLEEEVDEETELKLAKVGLGATAGVALLAWAVATPLDGELDGTSGFVQSLMAGLVTLLVLVFAVAVENLFANLLAFPGSEGATLRTHHRKAWWLSILVVTALFFHTLLNPRGELADSLESTNVRVVMVTVVAFLLATLAVKAWFGHTDRGVGVAGPPVAPLPQIAPSSSRWAPPEPVKTWSGPPPLVSKIEPHRRGGKVKWIVALIAVLALAALIAVVVVQHGRDTDRFDSAHEAYEAGDCELAIEEYDRLLDSSRLVDTAGVKGKAERERAECAELMEADAIADNDPGAALTMYAEFVEGHPDSPLTETIAARVALLFDSNAADRMATEATCDRLDELQLLGLFSPADLQWMQAWCSSTYLDAGRDADAYEMAMVVLTGEGAADVQAEASIVAQGTDAACADVDNFLLYSDVDLTEDSLVPFLQRCMTVMSDPGHADALALLQVVFLSELPFHADAPAVETALLANYAACGYMDRLTTDPMLTNREGFVPNVMFTCAQTAEYLGDVESAVEWYQWFVDNAPFDPRFTTARDGLARSLIKQAEQAGSGELPPPTDTGGSGSSLTEVTIYNDSPAELRIVISGPESRIEVIPASPTSDEYSLVGPLSCRTDVPTLTITVAAGDYRVLVEDISGGVRPFTGTWNLTSGDRFASCFYIVTTFG